MNAVLSGLCELTVILAATFIGKEEKDLGVDDIQDEKEQIQARFTQSSPGSETVKSPQNKASLRTGSFLTSGALQTWNPCNV
jgi:hypothetical protein